jgi:hypothetical protein
MAQHLIILEDVSWSMEDCDGGEVTRQDRVRDEMDHMLYEVKREVGQTEIDVYHAFFNCTVYPITGPYKFQTYNMETVEKRQPYFGTALYKAIVQTMDFAMKLPGRKKVVILTDGEDEDSEEFKEDAVRLLDKTFLLQHDIKVYLYGSTMAALTSNIPTFADVSFYGDPVVQQEQPTYDFENEHMSQSSISASSSREDSEERYFTPASQVGTLSQLSQGLANDFLQGSSNNSSN